jgi:hypothetical protein
MSIEDVRAMVVQVGTLLSAERADVHISIDAPCVGQSITHLRYDE